MPKYQVELHDGRKFQVEADSPPSEADVMTHLTAAAGPDFGPKTPQAGTTPVSESEPGTFWGGVKKSLVEQATHAMGGTDANGMATWHAASPAVEAFANTPIAHPTGIDKIDGFLSPASLAMLGAGAAVGGAGGAVKRGAVATAKQLPISGSLRLAASAAEASPALKRWIPFADAGVGAAREFAQTVKDKQMGVARGAAQFEMPNRAPTVVDRAPRAAQVIGEPGTFEPPMAAPDLTRPVQAGSLSQAELRARIEAAQGGLPPQQPPPASMQPTVGQLRMAAGEGGQSASTLTTPMAGGVVEPTAIPSQLPSQPPPIQTVRDQVGHALDPARVDVGAQQTGRAAGMTKQQVRDVATPVLGEAQGAASPILPEAVLKRMVDTLKALPKGGPEREAYVAKATSGKTQWQVENIRRTLEHLGLIVPIAAAAGSGSVRDEVMRRLRSEQPGQQLEQ